MIAKNDLVESGDKALYVQVIDPKNNVLGLNNELVFNEDVLNYSLISSFNYENNNLDICEYISSDESLKRVIIPLTFLIKIFIVIYYTYFKIIKS